MSGHELPGCFPESVCSACLAELECLRAIEAAALALVEACFLGEPTEEYGTERYYVFCRGQAHRSDHQDGCLWQSLVRAVRGEEAP